MKCLFLAARRYPFTRAVEAGLAAHNIEVKTVDYEDFFSRRVNRFVQRYHSLPHRVKKPWAEPYERKVNKLYLEIFRDYQPDFVFVYNNQLGHPDFFKQVKEHAKLVFMLGDHPLYTPTSIYNLHILFYADYIISPDSMWCEQLSKIGIKNTVFDCLGFGEDTYYPREVTPQEMQEHGSDFVYIGNSHKTNWGYKRVLFLNIFKDFNFRAYISGDGMPRWTNFFPEVKPRIIPHDRYDPEFNNMVYNCSKIAPIEHVPSLFNGIHVRVMDSLGAGVLPLCEHSVDLLRVFEGIEVPVIRNYNEGPEVARFWLENETKRKETVQQMRDRIVTTYAPSMIIERMLEYVFK